MSRQVMPGGLLGSPLWFLPWLGLVGLIRPQEKRVDEVRAVSSSTASTCSTSAATPQPLHPMISKLLKQEEDISLEISQPAVAMVEEVPLRIRCCRVLSRCLMPLNRSMHPQAVGSHPCVQNLAMGTWRNPVNPLKTEWTASLGN